MTIRNYYWNGSADNGNWMDDTNFEQEDGSPVDGDPTYGTNDMGPGWASGDPADPGNTDNVFFLGARLLGTKLANGPADKERRCHDCTMDKAYADAAGTNLINPNSGYAVEYAGTVIVYGATDIKDGFMNGWGDIYLHGTSSLSVDESSTVGDVYLYDGIHSIPYSCSGAYGTVYLMDDDAKANPQGAAGLPDYCIDSTIVIPSAGNVAIGQGNYGFEASIVPTLDITADNPRRSGGIPI